MLKKIIKNDYALSVLAKIIKIVIGLLSSSFLTRYLGIVNRGEYSYINSVITVSGLILNFGIYQSYTYYYRKEGESVFSKYISISLLQFTIYMLLGVLISFVTNNLTITLICLTIPFKIVRSQMDNIILVQNVRLRMQSTMLFSVVGLITNFLLFAGLYLGLIPSSVVPVIVFVILIDIIAVVRYFVKEWANVHFVKVNYLFLRDILKFGFLPMLSALLVTLNYSVDVFFLKRMGTSLELSLYSVAAGVMNYIWLVPDAFKDVLFSRVARKDYHSSVIFSTKFSLLFLIITTIGFAFFGKVFLNVMYGSDFLPSYGVTMVLFLGVYSMIFFKMFGVVLIGEGKRVPFFLMLLASVILNVILNYSLIPSYGMYGAAYASVGSYNLCGLLFLLYFSKSSNIPIKKFLTISKEDISNIKSIIHRSA